MNISAEVVANRTRNRVSAVGYIVARGVIDDVFLLFSVPLVLYGLVLSLCLQVPDLESDQALGKRTLVGLIGGDTRTFW